MDYQHWIERFDTITDHDRRLINRHIALFPRQPLLSVVMPAYNTPAALLREAIASVKAQIYPMWELCVADDCSPDPAVPATLADEARRDPRVRWIRRPVNGHISAASNSALDLATGEFVLLMDHDDLLPENALYEVALEILTHPEADVIYSDEDRIDSQGRRDSPYFKPMWSPELLAGHNMISHLGAYRRSLVSQLGGLREGFEGSQDWDLSLRATAATTPDRVRHIPSILYHWRWHADTPSFSEAQLARCQDAGRRAVEDWLMAEGAAGARVEPARMVPGWNRVIYSIPDPPPLVTVIVSAGDRPDLLQTLCEGVFYGTEWPADRLELLAVGSAATTPGATGVLAELACGRAARVLTAPHAFNHAQRINLAANESLGSILALVMDAIEIIEPDWLSELVSVALQPETGIAGAKLLYPDGSVRHAGVALGPNGRSGQILRRSAGDDPGYYGQLALRRSLSAVSGACMVLRRAVFDEAGGLDTDVAETCSDVDLCLRIADLGYRIVWAPDAVLVHSDRTPESPQTDVDASAAMRDRWGSWLDRDPYHNPNIMLHEGGGPMIPAPPRRPKPWLRQDLAGQPISAP